MGHGSGVGCRDRACRGQRGAEDEDVFVGDQVQREAGGALFADEVALEESCRGRRGRGR